MTPETLRRNWAGKSSEIAEKFAAMTLRALLAAVAVVCIPPLAISAEDDESISPQAIGERLETLEFLTIEGTPVTVDAAERERMLAIAFLGTECPLVRLYVPKLNQLADEFGDERIEILAIDSNQQDSLLEMSAFQRRVELKVPFLKDPGSVAATQLGATRTPQVLLFDREGVLRYRGRIDDQYGVGYARASANRNDLREAIDELLRGDEVSVPETEVVGCLIGRPGRRQLESPITYANTIARIVQTHCLECHRSGEIAPFSLEHHDDVVGWAEMIEEVVLEGRMPPWSADPAIGEFENARGVSEIEQAALTEWVRAGAPLGDLSEVPEPPSFTQGWQLPREPDLVIPMSRQPFQVPASGVVEYQYFVVDPGFEEDKWIDAAQVVPGDHGVVHHAIVFYRAPEQASADHLGWITAFVPGQRVEAPRQGLARRIPAGSRLIFQMHYTPNGRPAEDVTAVGLCFVDEQEVEREVVTLPAIERDFEIPPHAADHVVSLELSGFPSGSQLIGVAPHMHFRGSQYRLDVEFAEADRIKQLLNVPQYDFNWQHSYRFAEPLELEPAMTFHSTCVFDNSASNLANPDPSQPVVWGDQTWEEMAVAFFEVALPPGVSAEELFLRRDHARLDRNQQAMAVATRFMQRFDQNDDHRVTRGEVPEAFAALAFARYDSNRDNRISEAEIVKFLLQVDEGSTDE